MSAHNVYIVDSGHYRVLKEAISGSSYSESTVTTSALTWPYGVAAGGNGDIYIGDSSGNRVLREDLADSPTLSFASTPPGSTSSDSPQTVTLQNFGNAALDLSVPTSGTNPGISANFTLTSNGASACPLVSAGASGLGILAAGQSCQLPVSFTAAVDYDLRWLIGGLVETTVSLYAHQMSDPP